MPEVMKCYRHPKRDTRISCATCGRPICTECMVQTDVGIKCPDDARLPRGARAGVMKTNQIAKTVLAGAGVAAAGLLVVFAIFQIGFLTFILSAAAGYGAGTLIHRAGGRNGGPVAMTTAGIATFLPFLYFLLPPLLNGAFPIYIFLSAIIAVVAALFASR
ncbi:MAG: B-box zinc finger protein [Rubrobacter sp.]